MKRKVVSLRLSKKGLERSTPRISIVLFLVTICAAICQSIALGGNFTKELLTAGILVTALGIQHLNN